MKTPSSARRAIASLLLLSTATAFATPPADYAGAGRNQGALDATQNAKALGRQNGVDDGKARGIHDGYAECAGELTRQAVQNGQRQGDRDGTDRGSNDASVRASEDGQLKGAADGAIDGDSRADRQANADATPKGTADGIAEANQTDAAARGAADGKIAGNQSAKADANAEEYQPARDAYERERYAESIRSEATINLGGASAANAASSSAGSTQPSARFAAALTDALQGPGDPTIPDVKPTLAAEKAIAYCKANAKEVAQAPAPAPSPGPSPAPSSTPVAKSEFEKCVDDYKPAYQQSFKAAFRTEYLAAHQVAFNQLYGPSKAEGCQNARRADYRPDFDRAYRRAFDESYRLVFDRVYRNIFDRVYSEVFARASAEAFDRNYAAHYDAHYADAKAKAIASRTGELYTNAHKAAKAAEYAAKYPIYAREVIARARADEAAEFNRIPIRLLGLGIQESVRDGIQEPGEKLTVSLDLRNFADATIAAREIDIRAVAKSSGIAIPGAVAILTRDLAAKSLNHVVGALDIRLDESALGANAAVEIQISVRGNRLATETVNLTAKRLTTLELVETPVIRLGYPGAVRVRVTNRSSLALPENATLALSTNMPGVVFSKTSDAVNGLGAGEAREVSFPFNADQYTEGHQVDFTASLNLASGRRIGLLNESRSIPSLQDYAFRIRNGLFDGDISDLRKSGKTRLKVFVKNISTRQATGTLTLTASIAGPNAANFTFTKGNQIVLDPVTPGQEANGDKIVVKANQKSSGGTMVLEVREAGKLIGIYRENF